MGIRGNTEHGWENEDTRKFDGGFAKRYLDSGSDYAHSVRGGGAIDHGDHLVTRGLHWEMARRWPGENDARRWVVDNQITQQVVSKNAKKKLGQISDTTST